MTPEVLRVMMLDIVPTELANKMNSKVGKYPTWQKIVQHVKEKYDWRRQYQISQALHGTARKQYANALGAGSRANQPPTDAQPPSTGIPGAQVPNPVATIQELYDMVAAMKGKGKGDRTTAKKGGKSKGKGAKFIFRGCWECGAGSEGDSRPNHSRHECPQWKRICNSDGVPPAGHQGVKDKALAKWKASRPARTARKVNALGVETQPQPPPQSDLTLRTSTSTSTTSLLRRRKATLTEHSPSPK